MKFTADIHTLISKLSAGRLPASQVFCHEKQARKAREKARAGRAKSGRKLRDKQRFIQITEAPSVQRFGA